MDIEKTQRIKRVGTYAAIFLVTFMVLSSITLYVTTDDDDNIKIHFKFSSAVAAEADPGAGVSGFLEFYVVPLASAVRGVNATATIEAAALGYSSSDGFSIDTDSETAFAIIVRARWNKTNAYDSVGSEWGGNKTCRIKITCSGDITISNTTGTLVFTQNSSTNAFIWGNAYWDNSGSGYQISDDGTITVSEICIEAKY